MKCLKDIWPGSSKSECLKFAYSQFQQWCRERRITCPVESIIIIEVASYIYIFLGSAYTPRTSKP